MYGLSITPHTTTQKVTQVTNTEIQKYINIKTTKTEIQMNKNIKLYWELKKQNPACVQILNLKEHTCALWNMC